MKEHNIKEHNIKEHNIKENFDIIDRKMIFDSPSFSYNEGELFFTLHSVGTPSEDNAANDRNCTV